MKQEELLGNHIDVINGYAFKSLNFLNEKEEGALPVIKIKNVANGDVHLNGVQYHANDNSLSRFIVKKGDVLLALTGNHPSAMTQVVGEASLYKLNEKAFLNQRVAKIKPKESLDNDYLYYFLKDDATHDFLANQSSGSANQANISKSDIENIPIELPLFHEQKAIATVLSSIDDKIDLLHRQNVTLEVMAETLFRQWFMEEAKEDWEEVKIKDFEVVVTDFVANGSFASLKDNVTLVTEREDYALFMRNTDLKSDFKTKVYVTEHSYNFLNKTKLFGNEVIISSVGDVGSVYRCPKFNIPMTLGNNVIMLKSKYSYFFYLFFKSEHGQNLLYGITSGSVQEKFNKTSFRDIVLIYPSIDFIQDFENTVKPFFDKIDINKTQIRTLTTLRDTLLPKLMSGEVRVKM